MDQFEFSALDNSEVGPTSELRPWVTPEIRELPRLTDLTLDTGAGIPGMGGIGGGGSTVIP